MAPMLQILAWVPEIVGIPMLLVGVRLIAMFKKDDLHSARAAMVLIAPPMVVDMFLLSPWRAAFVVAFGAFEPVAMSLMYGVFSLFAGVTLPLVRNRLLRWAVDDSRIVGQMLGNDRHFRLAARGLNLLAVFYAVTALAFFVDVWRRLILAA